MRPRPSHLRSFRPGRLLVLLSVCFAFLLYCMPLRGFDVWWHLRLGRWIAENAQVPRTDLFTYASLGAPYLDQHWGFQVVVWLLYGIGGVSLLVVAKAALVAGAAWAGMASRDARTPPSLVALVWLLPICVLTIRNFVRPEIFTLVSLSLTLWILREAEDRPRLLLLLPVQQVVVINMHAVAVLNVVAVACYVGSRTLLRWRSGSATPSGPGAGLEWAVLGGMTLAGVVSPYGIRGLLFPILLLEKSSVDRAFWSSVTHELVSPLRYLTLDNLDNVFLMAFYAEIVFVVVSFVLVWRDRRFDPYRLLLLVAFTTLAMTSQRNINVFALVGGMLMMWNLADWLSARPRARAYLSSPRLELVVGLLLAVLIVSVVDGSWQRITHAPRRFGIGEAAHYYIHGPARFAGTPGMPARAYVADFGQAGIYVFHNAPEHRPFIDGRLEHPRRSTIVAYREVLARLADPRAMARGDRSFLALIEADPQSPDQWPAIVLDTLRCLPQIRALLRNPDWRAVFIDRTGAVFLSTRMADRLGLREASVAPLYAPRNT